MSSFQGFSLMELFMPTAHSSNLIRIQCMVNQVSTVIESKRQSKHISRALHHAAQLPLLWEHYQLVAKGKELCRKGALQWKTPYRCHSIKFLKTLWWLLFKLVNQIARTVEGGDVNCTNRNVEIYNSASHSSCILIGQLKRKPSESCQKLIKNFVEWQR